MSYNSQSYKRNVLSNRQTWLTGVGLFVLSMVVLLSTLDVGYSRDEAFYFDYGQSYDDWLVSVEATDAESERANILGRHEVLRVWKGNFEHPPLMKSLFGLARRYLGRKLRTVGAAQKTADGLQFRISGLTPSDGFQVGAEARILGPLISSDVEQRTEVGRGTVVERFDSHAALLVPDLAREDFLAACRTPQDERVAIANCQAEEMRDLALLDEGTAMRLPGMVSGALVVVLTFLLGLHLFGWQVGVFGGLAFLFVPRNFYHAHLACFDMPIVAATLATFYAFWRSLDDRRWAIAAGLLWGVALLIKHNAFFLPVPLILCWLWFGRNHVRIHWNRGFPKVSLPPLPVAFLVMPPVALTLFFVAWPRMWYDPFVALAEYFAFHLEHVHYLQWYFGEPLQVPPFPVELPFVLTLHTVPVTLTILTFVGLAYALKLGSWKESWRNLLERRSPSRHERSTFFAAMNGFFPIVLIALPSVPIFGGVKHWMTAMPFLLLFAGYGLFKLCDQCFESGRSRARPFIFLGLASLVLFGAASESIRGLAHGTGYYNRFVSGGVQGAAERQMMRTYWGVGSHEALDWLNRYAPREARVYFQNNPPRAIEIYKRDGELRQDIKPVRSAHAADIALVEPQKSFTEAEDLSVRRSFQAAGPLWTVEQEGVPMLRVYVRDPSKLLR